MKPSFFVFCSILLTLLAMNNLSYGEVYKYKDKNGNWYYTDTPEKFSDDLEQVAGMINSNESQRDFHKKLLDQFKPQTAIEKASLGTVTVISAMGKGSGFFITENGYIITNRHVIKGDDTHKQEAESYFNHVDERIEDMDTYFRDRERELKQVNKRLDEMKQEIEKEEHPSRKREMEERYKQELERYRAYEKELASEKQSYNANKNEYIHGKRDYTWRSNLSNLKRNFTIVLKDGSEETANLITVSKTLDLALLKLEGCKTPVLKPIHSQKQRQGQRVYAIGSPIGMRDSVCSGVISGFSDGYVKTDAKIYPGNSGGPLVDEGGSVIGINTLKMITYQFEGLGFAIPIESALKEFQNEIGTIQID